MTSPRREKGDVTAPPNSQSNTNAPASIISGVTVIFSSLGVGRYCIVSMPGTT